jgi:hypothetical protein
MSNTYSFWYSEVFTHKGYFKADSLQEADEMLRMVNNGDIGLDDLPAFKNKPESNEIITEPAELEDKMPAFNDLYYSKIASDYLVGVSPDLIRERFEGLIPSVELEAILAYVMHRYSEVISWEG